MGTITETFATVFRDYVTDGVPASGPHEPEKVDIRAIGPIIESALGTAGLGGSIDVAYATRAEMNADLAHPANSIGLVYADSTSANNDLYTKIGASGAGSWALTTILHDAVAAAASEPLAEAAASAASAQEWAEGTTPGGPGTDSAKGWAEEAQTQALAVGDDARKGRIGYSARFPDGNMLAAFLDSARRRFAYFTKAGELDADLTEVRFPGYTLKNRLRLDRTNRVALLSSNGRLLRYLDVGEVSTDSLQAQLDAVAGDRDAAGDRVGQFLDSYGNPRRWYFNEHLTRRWRYLRRKLLLGESVTATIAMIGDSFTHAPTRYTGPLAETLIDELGDAGGGWTGYGVGGGGILPNGNARPALYGYSRSASWDISAYVTSVGPDIGQITSSTPGEKVTRTGPDAAKLAAVTLFWVGTADGVIRYRWNGGAWTSRNVQGTVGALQTAALSANQPTSGAWTLEIEVVSGTVTLCGDNSTGTDPGVLFHKLGSTGSQAFHWAAADFSAGLIALQPHIVTVMLATNDQTIPRTPAAFGGYLETIVTRIRTAIPLVDVVIAMPADNQRANAYAMPLYAAEARRVAVEQNCAFMDLQYLFGDDPADYASDGPLPLNNSDDVHPEPATGGRVIVDAFCRFLQAV